MNCRRAQPLLSRHLEARLSQWEALAVEAHLADCPVCRRRRDQFRADGAALRLLTALPPPADLERRAVRQWLTERGDRCSSSFVRSLKGGLAPVAGWRAASGAALLAVLLTVLPSLRAHWGRLGRNHGVRIATGIDVSTQWSENPPGMRAAPLPGRKRPVCLVASPVNGAVPAKPVSVPQGRSRSFPQAGYPRSGWWSFTARGTQATASPVVVNAGSPPRPDDLDLLNGDPLREDHRWAVLSRAAWDRIEARIRGTVRVRDDFVTIPFPRLASTSNRQIAQAAESYKREAAIVDVRLAREVTCAFKATALSDLCDQLRTETGIQLTAGPSVADEKVTVFCEKLPLREVMRQLSRPFGYTWLRTKEASGVGRQAFGESPVDPNAQRLTPNAQYRYELVQDLRSQLLEEELRNRDRDESLLALEKDIERYRPFLGLSPDEALERAKTASPAEKPLLETLSGSQWGPLHMYSQLTSQELATLRAGQELTFSEAPRPGEKPRPEMGGGVLPPEIARGELQSLRHRRLIQTDEGWEYTPEDSAPAGALPPAAIPEARGEVRLSLDSSDLGQFTINGTAGVFTIGKDGGVHWYGNTVRSVGSGRSPAVQQPDNAAANAGLAHDPALQGRVTVAPVVSGQWPVVSRSPDRPLSTTHYPLPTDRKLTSAEVLEALHRATGMPIVADFYTRLFKPDAVSVRNQGLYPALNQLADTMRMRWHKEGGWLQLRSLTFYDDRRKEVPNRLLSRWANARRQHGALSLDDLVEIAQLPDAQLDAGEMAEGARDWWGLTEWDQAGEGMARPHLRYLAQLTPDQRREAMSATGLPFDRMTLSQQQQFMAFGLGGAPLQSLQELAGAALRVEYTQPGGFQWGEPGWSGYYTRWVIPLGPGPQDRRVPRPPVTARTREDALAAVRRIDASLREALFQAVRRADPRITEALSTFEEQQIFPTQRDLTFVYIPGATNARSIKAIAAAAHSQGQCNYRLR